MFHESIELGTQTANDVIVLEAITEALELRDPEWVAAMTGHAEYLNQNHPPLSIWIEAILTGEMMWSDLDNSSD